ncbi:phosphatase PAP2 family protein [Bradyrhizobium sp. SZCCHNR2012]|uniref:phosphatase PAP2 family protein n=1 Tax=Bradyrhizobium sp. SZCCHNR2012 TaxID=3057377 RepID=UPI0028E419FC|nr:phosphatase PAP2 family protein [Bradyrhizobium sp. SZCCHNR2012]
MLEPALGRLLPNFFRHFPTAFAEREQLEARHGNDGALAWSLFRLNWLVLTVLLAVFDLCLMMTDFRIQSLGYLVVLGVAAIYGVTGHLNAQSAHRAQPRLFSFLIGLAQVILGMSILTSLTYIATAANLPLQDANLLAIDRALGFDFRQYLKFADSSTWLIVVLAFCYRSIFWQIFLVLIGLPLAGYCRRTAEFVLALMLALVMTCCITMVVPAVGVYQILGLVPSDHLNIIPDAYYDTAREMPLIRAGELRLLDVSHLVGVVTFPSFHAASAILYAWALWPCRLFRPVNIGVNGAMLIATPIGGGHFLIDVLAGIAVAISALCVARFAARTLDADRATSDKPSWSVVRPR